MVVAIGALPFGAASESGLRESNPFGRLGKPEPNQWAKTARQESHNRTHCDAESWTVLVGCPTMRSFFGEYFRSGSNRDLIA